MLKDPPPLMNKLSSDAFTCFEVLMSVLWVVSYVLMHATNTEKNYVHPTGGVDILFLLFPASGVRRPTWFSDILGNSSYPIFTKFGMQVYWVNSLYGIAFGDDCSIAN